MQRTASHHVHRIESVKPPCLVRNIFHPSLFHIRDHWLGVFVFYPSSEESNAATESFLHNNSPKRKFRKMRESLIMKAQRLVDRQDVSVWSARSGRWDKPIWVSSLADRMQRQPTVALAERSDQ